ncbi:hypothetical protein ACFZCV_20530 [Streptomyces sp. NPDC007920]|uniref:hypothetical protein n=1 Tax=Streptomyces sp. NPDC007920 TaxID=3364794 RepID=UPI0036E68711
MTLQDHVANNPIHNSRRSAEKALLDAITGQVERTLEGGGAAVTDRLHKLAQAYALVVHAPKA